MKWISVKDKLPEVDVLVQAWRREYRTAKLRKVGDMLLWHFDNETHYTYEEPSHWMPLPEPPKE